MVVNNTSNQAKDILTVKALDGSTDFSFLQRKTKRTALFTGVDRNSFYKKNLGARSLEKTNSVVFLPGGGAISVELEPVSKDVTWKRSWGGSQSLFLFKYSPEAESLIGFNIDAHGRFNRPDEVPANQKTIKLFEGKYVCSETDKTLLRLQQAIPIRIEIKSSSADLQGAQKSDFIPYAIFGASLYYCSAHDNDRGEYRHVERQVLCYPNGVLCAERTIYSGPASDCPAENWDDKLTIVNGAVTPNVLEAGSQPGFKLEGVSYHYSLPEEVLSACGFELPSSDMDISDGSSMFATIINSLLENNSTE